MIPLISQAALYMFLERLKGSLKCDTYLGILIVCSPLVYVNFKLCYDSITNLNIDKFSHKLVNSNIHVIIRQSNRYLRLLNIYD